jgi:predicted membrane-bound dolichyl-phosphate-mannose-protein mannosyltransferase
VMAFGIRVFGDRALGYRLGSVLAGTAALALLFALVRAAGGSEWAALAATGVLAVDNLLLVHGRIATLDIYALAFMLGAVLLYLKDRPLLAGASLGLGATTKLVGVYALFVIGLLEAGRWITRRRRTMTTRRPRPPVESLAACIGATVVTYAAVLQILDMAVPAYVAETGHSLTSALAHTHYIVDYARQLTAGAHAPAISSSPWSWLIGRGSIGYLVVTQTASDGAIAHRVTEVAFRGQPNPVLLYVTIPALAATAWRAHRRAADIDLLALAWFAGTFVPLALQAGFQHRITYMYYLVIALPSLCIAATRLFAGPGLVRVAAVGWSIGLVIGFIELFPFRTVL